MRRVRQRRRRDSEKAPRHQVEQQSQIRGAFSAPSKPPCGSLPARQRIEHRIAIR
jgi:hypothetical protein